MQRRREGGMENVFYAALALHVAGKPINKENIRAVLQAAGTPVEEPALDAMAVLVDALETTRQRKRKPVDPKIIKLLTAKLAQQKVQISDLEAALLELERSARSPRGSDGHTGETRTAVGTMWAAPAKETVCEPEASCAGAVPDIAIKEAAPGAVREARYAYGVAACGKAVELGPVGIGGARVYTIPFRDLAAIVHECTAEPYQSDDDETVRGWVEAHQRVLDLARGQLGVVLPLGFDTILQPQDDSVSPDQVVKDWLKKDHDRLWTVIERVQGKDEYVVQVSYDVELIGRRIAENSEDIKKLREEIDTKSPGTAYVLRQRLEGMARAETERLADEWFNDFYDRIKRHVDDIVVEKTKRLDRNKVMLLNLSCLASSENAAGLGVELERIDSMEGFSVHFSGPWPPYSFVNKPVLTVGAT
jgi:hypothetical protein